MLSTNHPQSCVLRCRWLLRPDQPPLENARLTAEGGTLVDIATVPADERALIENIAVVPPIWNAHCHLEFSALQRPFPAGATFPEWICQVMAWRAMQTADSAGVAIGAGMAECRRAQVAGLGEITTREFPAGTYSGDGLAVTTFREAIGLTKERMAAAITDVRQHLSDESHAAASGTSSSLIRGISPHAPYTVHPQLLADLVELSIERCLPLSMHVAETLEERQLLEECSGPFVEMLRLFGLPVEDVFHSGPTVSERLNQLVRAHRVQIVHGNYLTTDELQILAEHKNATLVYCPRTHRHFNHTAHPWRTLLTRGGRVALGTDGRGSNPDLDLWREFQSLMGEAGDLPVHTLLRVITTDAAISLGRDAAGNRLRTGEKAAGTILSLPESSVSEPLEILRNPEVRPVSRWLPAESPSEAGHAG